MKHFVALSYVQTDATTPNIVGPTMLGVIASVCKYKLTFDRFETTWRNKSQQHATTSANMQQGVQMDATCHIQQCCVRLHGALLMIMRKASRISRDFCPNIKNKDL